MTETAILRYQPEALPANVPVPGASVPVAVFSLTMVTRAGTPLTTFDPPLVITVRYTLDQLAGAPETSLVIYFRDGEGRWVALDTVVDTGDKTATASVGPLTLFGLFAHTAPSPTPTPSATPTVSPTSTTTPPPSTATGTPAVPTPTGTQGQGAPTASSTPSETPSGTPTVAPTVAAHRILMIWIGRDGPADGSGTGTVPTPTGTLVSGPSYQVLMLRILRDWPAAGSGW